MKQKILFISLLGFVLLVMVDPTGNIFHLKNDGFVLILIISCLIGNVSLSRKIYIHPCLIFAFAFLSILTGGLVGNYNFSDSLPYLRTLLFLLIIIPLSTQTSRGLLTINNIVGVGLAAIIIFLYFSSTMGFWDISRFYNVDEIDKTTILVSNRSFLSYSGMMFFYKSMPFLFLPLIHFIRNKNYILAILLFIPIFMGMSRTPILCALALFAYVIYTNYNIKGIKIIIGLFLSIFLIWLLLQLLNDSDQSSGDLVKFTTTFDLLSKSDVFGHGVGVLYFSKARNIWVTNSEMTYFEIIYQYGWILGLWVIYIFFKPAVIMLIKGKTQQIKDVGFSYFMYLIVSGTNPLLINSTGLYVFSFALLYCYKNIKTLK